MTAVTAPSRLKTTVSFGWNKKPHTGNFLPAKNPSKLSQKHTYGWFPLFSSGLSSKETAFQIGRVRPVGRFSSQAGLVLNWAGSAPWVFKEHVSGRTWACGCLTSLQGAWKEVIGLGLHYFIKETGNTVPPAAGYALGCCFLFSWFGFRWWQKGEVGTETRQNIKKSILCIKLAKVVIFGIRYLIFM